MLHNQPGDPWVTHDLGPAHWDLQVGGASVHIVKRVFDQRGDLVVAHFEDEIPFQPKRFFTIFNVPETDIRGEHAHKSCHQFLMCVRGSVIATVDNGKSQKTIKLDRPNIGVYMPPMTWGIQSEYSPDAVLLVFASDEYDPDDYIRNYEHFLKITKS